MNGFHGRIKNHSNQNSQFEFEIISDAFFPAVLNRVLIFLIKVFFKLLICIKKRRALALLISFIVFVVFLYFLVVFLFS